MAVGTILFNIDDKYRQVTSWRRCRSATAATQKSESAVGGVNLVRRQEPFDEWILRRMQISLLHPLPCYSLPCGGKCSIILLTDFSSFFSFFSGLSESVSCATPRQTSCLL